MTHIIHNAWRVDFNLSLASFESYVANTRSLIDFSASCEHPVRLLLTSSAAAVYKWDVENGAVPEEVIDNASIAAVSGYGSSKYVAEQVCGSICCRSCWMQNEHTLTAIDVCRYLRTLHARDCLPHQRE